MRQYPQQARLMRSGLKEKNQRLATKLNTGIGRGQQPHTTQQATELGGAGRILSSATSALDARTDREKSKGLQRRRRHCPLLPGWGRPLSGGRAGLEGEGPVLTPGTALLSARWQSVLRLAHFCPGRVLAFLSLHGSCLPARKQELLSAGMCVTISITCCAASIC